MASAPAKLLTLFMLAFMGLVMMKYVSVFMLAGGRAPTSAPRFFRGSAPSNVAMGAGEGFSFPAVAETSENADLAAGIIGGFVGTFLFPLFNGLALGIILAGIFYLISNGEATRLLETTEQGRDFAPASKNAGNVLQQGGEEVVRFYNFSAVKINDELEKQRR